MTPPMFKYKNHWFRIDYGLSQVGGEEADFYTDFIELLHPEIEKWYTAVEKDYQGEWFALGRDKKGNYFWHQGSFGSCSGCDWLQSIHDEEGAIEFLKAMEKLMPLGKDIDRVLAYLLNEKINSCYASDEIQTIIELVNHDRK